MRTNNKLVKEARQIDGKTGSASITREAILERGDLGGLIHNVGPRGRVAWGSAPKAIAFAITPTRI